MKYILDIIILSFLISCSTETSQEELDFLAKSRHKILYADEENNFHIYEINKGKDYLLGYFSSENVFSTKSAKFSPTGDKISFIYITPSFRGIKVLHISSNKVDKIPLKVNQYSVISYLNEDSILFSLDNEIFLYSFIDKSTTSVTRINTDKISSLDVNPEKTFLAIDYMIEKKKYSFFSYIEVLNLTTFHIDKTLQKQFIGWFENHKVFFRDSLYKILDLSNNEIIKVGDKYLDSLIVYNLFSINESTILLNGGLLRDSDVNVNAFGVFLEDKKQIQRLFLYEPLEKTIYDIYYKK